MFLLPISWLIIGSVLGWLLSCYNVIPFWMALVGFYVWANWGNILYGKIVDLNLDYDDALEGERFWWKGNDKLNKAWINYIEAIRS